MLLFSDPDRFLGFPADFVLVKRPHTEWLGETIFFTQWNPPNGKRHTEGSGGPTSAASWNTRGQLHPTVPGV